MNVGHIFRCLVCLLVLSSVAQAGVVTVIDSRDYNDNVSFSEEPFFYTPGDIMDHPPHYRGVKEDWGWFHDVASEVPANATGIASATLAIEAWDVDYYDSDEWDGIYVNDVPIRLLDDTAGRNFVWTILELPQEILDELWSDGYIYVYMDIDVLNKGNRVMLRQAELTIEYLIDGASPGTDSIMDVYRFWADSIRSHFYTADKAERTKLVYNYAGVWTPEGVAYRAWADDTDPDATPVYRFWSDILGGHFYTIDNDERDKLLTEYSASWTYEGVVFYTYAEANAPADTVPVYRFWSDIAGHHFYTTSESEKQKLLDEYSYSWTYEGVAWYAFPPNE